MHKAREGDKDRDRERVGVELGAEGDRQLDKKSKDNYGWHCTTCILLRKLVINSHFKTGYDETPQLHHNRINDNAPHTWSICVAAYTVELVYM